MWSEFTTPKIPFAHFVSCLFVQARSVNLENTMEGVSDATYYGIEEVAEGVPDDKIHDYSRYADEPGLIPDSTENIHSDESLSLFSIYRIWIKTERKTSQQGDYKYVRYEKKTKYDVAPGKIQHAYPNQQNLKNGKVFVAFPENITNKGEATEKKEKEQYSLIGEASYQRYLQVLQGTNTSKLDRERHLKRSYVEKSFASGNKKTKNSKDKHEAKKVSEQKAYENDLNVLDDNRHKASMFNSTENLLDLENLNAQQREHKAYETFIRSARTVKALISAVVDCKIEDLEKYIKLEIRLTEDLVQYCLLCFENKENTNCKYLDILDLLLSNVDLEGKEPSVIIQNWRALCPASEDVQKMLTMFLKWQNTSLLDTFKHFKEAEEAKEAKEAEEAEEAEETIARTIPEAYEGQLDKKLLQLQQKRQELHQLQQQPENLRGRMFPEEGGSSRFYRQLLDIVRGPGVLKR